VLAQHACHDGIQLPSVMVSRQTRCCTEQEAATMFFEVSGELMPVLKALMVLIWRKMETKTMSKVRMSKIRCNWN
jgi:hypothetical protein